MNHLSGLDYVETITAARGRTVVLFHGYNADCHDLVPLPGVFPLGVAARWVFPNAPLTVSRAAQGQRGRLAQSAMA